MIIITRNITAMDVNKLLQGYKESIESIQLLVE